MDAQRPRDAVDRILAQWREQRPDLDTSPMGPIGRLKRCAVLVQQRLDRVFTEYGLSRWEFDVLATLRRSGPPYSMAPTALFSALMVSSGTMTHRLQGLESRRLVTRIADAKDGRSMPVRLTPSGLKLIDRAVEAHVRNEKNLLAPLGDADIAKLDVQLSRLLVLLESASGDLPAENAR